MAGELLTDRLIQATRCGSGRKEIWDTVVPGFGIRISAHSKSFFLVYRSPTARAKNGKPVRRRVSLGDYPKQRLVMARTAAAELRDQLETGFDPLHQEEEELVEGTSPTFEQLALDYVERYAKKRKASWNDDRIMVVKILAPAWGPRLAETITAKEVRRLLEKVSETAPVYANRVHSVLRSIFKWGIRQWDLEANPARLVEKLNSELARDRVLNPSEIRALWAIWSASDQPAAAVLQLRLLTAQRGNQIVRMHASHLEPQPDGAWWNVPATQTKTKRPYRVFLAPGARSILHQVGPHPSGGWFGPEHETQGANERIRVAGRRLTKGSGVPNWQPRDLRRTAATMMAERGVSRFIIKRVLGHVDREITAVYDLYSYDREVKEAVLILETAVREIVGEPLGK
jgi:integrase